MYCICYEKLDSATCDGGFFGLVKALTLLVKLRKHLRSVDLPVGNVKERHNKIVCFNIR